MADPADETEQKSLDQEDAKGLRARLDEQAALRREAETKLAEMEPILQENALFKAGLTTLNADQIEVLFAKGNLGQEALQARAKSLFGAVPAAGSSTPTAQTQETNDALTQMDQFAAGGTSVEPPQPAQEAFVKAVEEWTGTREELNEFIFGKNRHLLQG